MRMRLVFKPLRMKIAMGLWLIWQIAIALSCRPLQDDYAYLDIGSNQGFSNYLSDFWSNWGGNLTPSLIRIPFYLPSISGVHWWGFALYSFLTSLLVLFTSMILTTWLRGKSVKDFDARDITIAIFTCIGFEGIFSPGLLAAFVFGPASSTHLVPICFLIIGLWLCTFDNQRSIIKIVLWLPILISGFIAGNCNFAEGGLAIGVISILLIGNQVRPELVHKLGFTKIGNLIIFGVGTLIGFITIIASPGFKNRADSGNGLPSGFKEILIGFRSSFVSFSGDVITHPVWIFILIFAILFFGRSLIEEIVGTRALALIIVTALCYLSLIIGTAFAYAAWHQSVGLLFLLTPSALATAHFLLPAPHIVKRYTLLLRISSSILAIVILILITRVTILEISRGATWDRNLVLNSCLIKKDSQSKLLGSEVRYWPLGLGVEDINRWDWMSNNYKNWLNNPNFKKEVICD